jgi:hypothetical protein
MLKKYRLQEVLQINIFHENGTVDDSETIVVRAIYKVWQFNSGIENILRKPHLKSNISFNIVFKIISLRCHTLLSSLIELLEILSQLICM